MTSGINWDEVPPESGIDWSKVPDEEPKSLWKKTKGFLPATTELALGLGSGAVAAPLAGLAGLAGGVRSFLPGGREGQGADWVRATQDALTYEPESKVAQGALRVLGLPGELIAKGGDTAGEWVAEKSGSPMLGAGVNTGIQALPMLFGARVPGTKMSVRERMLPSGELPSVAPARAAREVANAADDALANASQNAGFAAPPTQVNPSLLNKIVEGAAGKVKTGQDLSVHNQPVANRLVGEHFSLPPEVPLSPDSLGAVRKQAGQAYEPVRGAGRITASPEYGVALDGIEAPYKNAAKDFPESARTEIIEAVQHARKGSFDSGSALDQISNLRDKADIAFRGGDGKLGGAYKDIAKALESEIERHLVDTGAPANIIADFRKARQTIAETYTVQKHLDGNNVNMQGLATELKKKPLVGDIRTVAEFGSKYKRAAQLPDKIGGVSMSPLDYAVSLGSLGSAVVSGNPMLAFGAAAPFARPLLRKGITSDFYQRNFVKPPSYGQSRTGKMVEALTTPAAAAASESFAQATEARKRELLRQLGLEE